MNRKQEGRKERRIGMEWWIWIGILVAIGLAASASVDSNGRIY